MSAPPVPPRPYASYTPIKPGDIPPPPPLPPLPATLRAQNEIYSRPSRYEVEEAAPIQMMAPRPHRVEQTVQRLNELVISEPTQGPMSVLPSLTAPLPVLAQLQAAAPIVQQPTHDPALRVAWCRDVFSLVDRSTRASSTTDPPVGPVSIPDPSLARLTHIAVPLVLQLASSFQGQKLPLYVAEAVAMRATLSSTGAFPEHVRHNPRTAFRDFETAARNGFSSAWFRLGRDYENFNDHSHAKDCFERGVKLNVESCLYRMGMAHLLGQLSLPQNSTQALPLLHRAATLASLTCPQPAYVYALLLLSEFTQLPPLPPSSFTPYIPSNSSPHLEARKHLERAAFLHFAPAQYKLGHAYEFAESPFPFDPLLSVQYYSLASQQGEVEADMALSKWFLCGSGGAAASGPTPSGGFEKDEPLALLFAEKAANRGLSSAQFAMGYYAEVGVGQPRSLDSAIHWYSLASQQGNTDAIERLKVLNGPKGGVRGLLTREEHEDLAKVKVERRRTIARERMETEVVSPPWEGKSFPRWKEVQQQQQQQPPVPGRKVVENIRKNSLAETERLYGPSSATLPTMQMPTPLPHLHEPPKTAAPLTTMNDPQTPTQPQAQPPRRQGPRYPWGDNVPGPAGLSSAPILSSSSTQIRSTTPTNNHNHNQIPYAYGPYPYRTDSPSGRKTPPAPVGGRDPSPARRVGAGRARSPSPSAVKAGAAAKLRLNLEDPGAVPPTPSTTTTGTPRPLPVSSAAPATGVGLPTPASTTTTSTATSTSMSTPVPMGGGKSSNKPQTFAEMGFHGAKAEDRECIVM